VVNSRTVEAIACEAIFLFTAAGFTSPTNE